MSKSDIAVSVRGISKSYTIAHDQEKHITLAETVLSRLKNPLRRSKTETFWALKDVSFDIKKGDVVGIIGRNGAGKSTLLKILSRITEPTSGFIDLYGRVGSLLEVGTGFHPELTGRENIYLNGAILGMRKPEINKHFDAIADFAGVEKFLDTPVKRYSSGMYVRLAFAVAAHLESEILIVDEVLAVGDAEFQKKCLGKMKDLSSGGRTVLFVSHNMAAVRQLCTTAIWLDHGNMVGGTETVESVLPKYSKHGVGPSKANGLSVISSSKLRMEQWFSPTRFTLTDQHGLPILRSISRSSEVFVQIDSQIERYDPALTIGYALYSPDGTMLYISYHTDGSPDSWPVFGSGPWSFRSRLPVNLLNPGHYRVELVGGLHCRTWLYAPGKNAPSLEFEVNDEWISPSPLWNTTREGILAPLLEWTCAKGAQRIEENRC